MYLLSQLGGGSKILGPAIIIDQTSTIVVEPDCQATITPDEGNIVIDILKAKEKDVGYEPFPPLQFNYFGTNHFITALKLIQSNFQCLLIVSWVLQSKWARLYNVPLSLLILRSVSIFRVLCSG